MTKPAKKRKLKMTTSTPLTTLRPSTSTATSSEPVEITKFKRLATGNLKIWSNRTHVLDSADDYSDSPASTARTKTAEEILEMWEETTELNGWDKSYYDSFIEHEELPPSSETTDQRNRPTGQGDKAIHEWAKDIDNYLRIILTLEGRGRNPPERCTQCATATAQYRCVVCDNQGLLCGECMRESHRRLPFHRIQAWNGTYFTKSSLKSLGLRIQLGHPPGEICPLPDMAWGDDFVVIDCDAVHLVGVDYCRCGATDKSQVEQLLERRLYPATTENPKTAATFRVLEVFELLQYESKVSPFELWKALARLTDNTGLAPSKVTGVSRNLDSLSVRRTHFCNQDRYPSFLRMVHEWRHLKLLKRNMRGHDPVRNAAQTKLGECAVLCPACPYPEINMPKDWEDEHESLRYIHSLNLALDACFRLRRKDVSSDQADPGLSQGFAYFVENGKFEKYLAAHADEVEPKSECSRHDAVNLADITPGQGYASSGVATVECARHNMKRPSAVCDLQKGERYCNMDYILHFGLVLFGLALLRTFIISYDIACQWSKHLLARLLVIDEKSESPLLKADTQVRFVVPKFHLPAHVPACQTKFAFMFTPGAGLGDGEAPERGWGDVNPLATSTREMGPGTRRDTLDYNFGDYNWRKIVDLGTSSTTASFRGTDQLLKGPSLMRKMDNAVSKVADHTIAHQELEATLDPEKLAEWRSSAEAWEKTPTMPNPFEMLMIAPKQDAIRKALAAEEAAQLAQGNDFSLSPDCSPSVLISRGIDLEAEQRALKAEMKEVWAHSRDRELTRVQLRSNTIVRKVEAWYQILQLYIPATVILRQQATGSTSIKPYDLTLWLPSQIGRKGPIDRRLVEIEYELRTAQAQEALTTLRRFLQRRTTVWDLKDRHIRGQGANTKALTLLDSIQDRISTARDTYRQARKEGVDTVFLPLEDSDIRSMARIEWDENSTTTNETNRTLSWIWRHSGAAMDNRTDWEAETIKVEWAKSRARACRYSEEINIVKEEMNRTSRFILWKQKEWTKLGVAKQEHAKANGLPAIPDEYVEGLRAYASRQASMWHGLQRRFEHGWQSVDKRISEARREIELPAVYYARKDRESRDLGVEPRANTQESSSADGVDDMVM
ncbi:hypothetical protein D9611_012394 [Ephemerocybe angulata]|uniref:CxC2-like cysteine cluster KDZ transposase-associated domain-containing protein n=1 Tax=Ephemerocybe angulata TaxID=980116 RepID=A0A8H5FKE2_9AGAR|nr:hypothetical protein D9611_012394 [Tulosesus angulatus]